jgi:hypothetical protein
MSVDALTIYVITRQHILDEPSDAPFLGFGTKSVMATTNFVIPPLEGDTNSVMNGTKSVMA